MAKYMPMNHCRGKQMHLRDSCKTSPLAPLKNETDMKKGDCAGETPCSGINEYIIELAFQGKIMPPHFLWCIGRFYVTSDLFHGKSFPNMMINATFQVEFALGNSSFDFDYGCHAYKSRSSRQASLKIQCTLSRYRSCLC